LHELNGKLEIESDGQGTSMRAIVPLFALARPTRHGYYGQVGQVVPSVSAMPLQTVNFS
jgi:hypothetical protein